MFRVTRGKIVTDWLRLDLCDFKGATTFTDDFTDVTLACHYWVNKDVIKEMNDELEVIVVMVMKKIIKDHGGWKWRTEEYMTILKDVKRSGGL